MELIMNYSKFLLETNNINLDLDSVISNYQQ